MWFTPPDPKSEPKNQPFLRCRCAIRFPCLVWDIPASKSCNTPGQRGRIERNKSTHIILIWHQTLDTLNQPISSRKVQPFPNKIKYEGGSGSVIDRSGLTFSRHSYHNIPPIPTCATWGTAREHSWLLEDRPEPLLDCTGIWLVVEMDRMICMTVLPSEGSAC